MRLRLQAGPVTGADRHSFADRHGMMLAATGRWYRTVTFTVHLRDRVYLRRMPAAVAATVQVSREGVHDIAVPVRRSGPRRGGPEVDR